MFLDSVDKYTLPVGIALFQTSYYAEYALTPGRQRQILLSSVVFVFQLHQSRAVSLPKD